MLTLEDAEAQLLSFLIKILLFCTHDCWMYKVVINAASTLIHQTWSYTVITVIDWVYARSGRYVIHCTLVLQYTVRLNNRNEQLHVLWSQMHQMHNADVSGSRDPTNPILGE